VIPLFKQLTRLLILLLVWMIPFHAQARSDVISISDPDFSQHLGGRIEYLEDPTGELSLEQVQQQEKMGAFRTYKHGNFQMGYSNSVYWIKLRIANHLPGRIGQSESDRFYLSVRYPLLDDVQFFHLREGRSDHYAVGDYLRFNQRFLKLNNFDYPISLLPGEQSEVFIRVQSSSSVSVPLYLETEKAYIEDQYVLNSFNGIYFGISLGLGIYNLFIWIGARKKVYGLYVLLILNVWFFNATIIGFSYRLWPQATDFQQIAVYLFSITAAISMCLFGMVFLKMRDFQPGFYKVILTAILIYLVTIPIIFFAPTVIAAKINVAVTLSGLVILFIAAIRSVLSGYRPARYFLIGQGAVLFGVFFTVLTSLGIIPLYSMAPEVMKWSVAFELIFFSFGLADLLNNERQLREKAQQESAQAQQKLLHSQIKLTEQLDNLVHQRTEELERANRRLQDLNKVDELTGLYNRRHLNEVFPNEYRRAYRENSHISLLVFDIDYFKKINDRYGHAFGDLCLVNVAQMMQKSLHRPPDNAFRYGGEEFTILLPNTDLDGALVVAESVREAIASLLVSDEKNSTSMTVSVGIASEVPQQRDGHEMMFKLADQRLYMAKENGRNQVVAFDDIEQPSLLALP
jgi:two-component system, sensor histidine kinase LadS